MKRQLVIAGSGAALVGALLLVRALVADDPLDRLARSPGASVGEAYAGSWHFPRGGPYVLGFECAAPCALAIDGKPIASGTGQVAKRVVFDAGVHAVEFERAGEGRLLWHPPGRRGPLEYVPASSLSSEPPATARFGQGAGAARADGLFALAIAIVLIVVMGLLIGGVFARLGSEERASWLAVFAVFAVALAIRLVGLGDAGQTWDEDTNWSAGRNYVTNLLSLDFRDASWQWNLEHPPLMKVIVGIGAQFADGYGPARFASAIMMALACALLVPIGARLGSARAGLYGALAAALSPHLVGHGQIVGHESAMALTYALAILGALAVWPAADHRALEKRLALVGAAVGLAIAARFVNGLLGPLVYAIVVARAPRERRFEAAWKAALIMPAAAICVFVALWPRMWTAPIAHLKEAWIVLRKPHGVEPFLGELTNRPPRTYFAIYLFATAPALLLGAAMTGLGWAMVRARRTALVLGLWLLVPMAVAFSPVRQDGVRYIIPSLFALALLAGFGVELIGRTIKRRRLAPMPAAVLAIGLGLACAQIRPYYIDYYGEHVGGPGKVAAVQRFEIAWWGEGLEDAVGFVNANATPGARVHRRCVVPNHLTWFRGDLWAGETQRLEDADWVVVYAPDTTRCELPSSLELVHTVSAGRAALVRVYRRR